MEERELPVGWDQASLAELIDRIEAGKNFRCIERPPLNGEIGIVKVSAVSWGRFREEESKTVPPGVALDSETRIRQGDLLFSRANTIELVGACVMVESLSKNLRLSDKILRLVPSKEAVKPWICRYLSSPQARKYLSETSSGNQLSMRNVSQRVLLDTLVPLAPLNEQRRIAAKLDTTLAAVESCRQRLDGVAELLKRFRQAVLAAATSGELTREWREERGAAEWDTKTLGDCGAVTGGITKNSSRLSLPLQKPYLRVANVYHNRIDLGDVSSIGVTEAEYRKTVLCPGDILIVEGNGSLQQVGRAAVWDENALDCVHQNHLIRWRSSEMRPKWALYWLMSPVGRELLEQRAKSTTGLHTLSVSKVSGIPIPVPTIAEQDEIISCAQHLFTLADQLEAHLTSSRKVVDRLTPALLAKAFRGELVPQDPEDEPASVLLERIRAARQVGAGAAKPSRRGRPKAAAIPAPINRNAAPAPSEPLPPDLLAQLLRECGALSERALLAVSELEPERFEQQLFRELERGTAREVQANGQVLLEAVG